MKLKKGLVIIADDDEAVGKLIKRMLIEKSLVAESDIRLFLSANEAWEFISDLTESPHIIFSSIDIDASKQGDMTGFDLLTSARDEFHEVVLVSMSGTHSYRDEAISKGADHFLAKPFSMADIEKIFA